MLSRNVVARHRNPEAAAEADGRKEMQLKECRRRDKAEAERARAMRKPMGGSSSDEDLLPSTDPSTDPPSAPVDNHLFVPALGPDGLKHTTIPWPAQRPGGGKVTLPRDTPIQQVQTDREDTGAPQVSMKFQVADGEFAGCFFVVYTGVAFPFLALQIHPSFARQSGGMSPLSGGMSPPPDDSGSDTEDAEVNIMAEEAAAEAATQPMGVEDQATQPMGVEDQATQPMGGDDEPPNHQFEPQDGAAEDEAAAESDEATQGPEVEVGLMPGCLCGHTEMEIVTQQAKCWHPLCPYF